MHKIYYDPENPAGFGGIAKLSRAAGQSVKQVSKWLAGQPTYTLHKPARKRGYTTRPYRTKGIDYQWQGDLAEMIPHARQNSGYKYILTLIDVFSRYAWAQPLKNKTPGKVVRALKIVFKHRKPKMYLQTDQGKEFENKTVHAFLATHSIKQFSVKSQFKASLVERWNRTLKSKMWRWFTHTGSYKWVDVLPKLVKSYNASIHRMIGMAPQDVNAKNEFALWEAQQPKDNEINKKSKYNVGDYVRVSKAKRVFSKGYECEWSEEVFCVKEVRKTSKPHTYKLVDYEDMTIEGVFYAEELQRVDKPTTFRIEKILQTKRVKGKVQRLVKWVGYKQPTWTSSDIERK